MEHEREAPVEAAPQRRSDAEPTGEGDGAGHAAVQTLAGENPAPPAAGGAQELRAELPADERMDQEAGDDVLRTFTTLMFVAAIVCAIPRQIWSVVILLVLGGSGAAWMRVRRRAASRRADVAS